MSDKNSAEKFSFELISQDQQARLGAVHTGFGKLIHQHLCLLAQLHLLRV